jgi:hypothetical protein
MTLLKKKDVARRWRSFERHFILIMKPFLIALLVLMMWDWLRFRGYHFPKEDEPIMISTVITIIGIVYGVIAALIINSVWGKYKKVVICILEKDKHTFLMYRDERMPIMIHLFLFSLSAPLLGLVIMLNYKEQWTGTVAVFLVTFILSLYWIVLIQLDNPLKSAWFAERTPKDWLTEDIDDYFNLDPNNKKEDELT